MFYNIRKHNLLISIAIAVAIPIVMTAVIAALLLVPHSNSYSVAFAAKLSSAQASGTAQWVQYMYGTQHQGYNPYETQISKSNVASLKLKWKFHIGGLTVAEPVVVNGVVYEGSENGYMYAFDASNGTLKWKTSLGVYTSPSCQKLGYLRGITGTAIVQGGAVYIGVGPYFFALNATTGSILWKSQMLGTSGTTNDFIYAGSTIADGKVYFGVASLCDNPLTQGMLYALNTTNGSIAARAAMVPNGQLGGGIWAVPTVDTATNTVIVTTGSIVKGNPYPMAASFVTLDSNTLKVKQYWQIPRAQQIADADFGCTPTIFPGPSGKTYVGCINKNSIYYVLDEANVSAGPVWQVTLGPGGNQGGVTGSFGSAAYVNGVLYIPTALATVNGSSFGGSIGAFNALTGKQLWRFGTAGPIVSSVVTANGLLYDTEGSTMEVRDPSIGNVLFRYTVGPIWGSVTVVNGVVYFASYDRNLYALFTS
jgi:polyvinyl alcohol dehydrogenase (cytochrome)